uniref:Uncharacterized protein n=1 Tax=Panagrolaimus sp. PS1159 TaxID=55785 RepID=A0AC35G7F0_9BILA
MDINYLKRKPESLRAYYKFLSDVAWDDLNNRIVFVFVDELELLALETSTFVCTLTKNNESIATEIHQNFQIFYNNLINSKHGTKFRDHEYMLEIVRIWKEYEESEYEDEDAPTLKDLYTENEIHSLLTDQSDPVIQKLMQYFGQGSSSERTRKYDGGDPPLTHDNDDFIEY